MYKGRLSKKANIRNWKRAGKGKKLDVRSLMRGGSRL